MRGTIAVLIAVLTVTSVHAWGAEFPAAEVSFSPCDGMICVPVTLSDGKTHVMLLDTGNVNSWLSRKTAQSLGKTPEPIMSGDKTVQGIFRIGTETVALGGKSLSGRFLALDETASGALPNGVDGALAYTVFKDQIVEIDYPRRRLRVGDAPLTQSAAPGAAMKLVTFGSHGPPIVTIEGLGIEGRALTAQFDTCFTGTMVVYDDAVERLGLGAASRRGRPQYFAYTDGGVTMNEAAFGRITFGTDVLANTPATIYFPAAGKNPVHQPDGLFEATVGNALFARSVVTLDFRSMTVHVRT
jgi:hypothetical protein